MEQEIFQSYRTEAENDEIERQMVHEILLLLPFQYSSSFMLRW